MGIGRATAELLAHEGARVVAAARGPVDLEEDRIEAVRVDLTDPAGPGQLVERALALHGRLDAVVNDVGGVASHDGFLEIDDASWAATLELKLMTAVRDAGGGGPRHRPARLAAQRAGHGSGVGDRRRRAAGGVMKTKSGLSGAWSRIEPGSL